MTTVYDAPPNVLIESVAEQLKGIKGLEPPEWAGYVKTGIHREKSPVNEDWWYVRLAAIMRKVYIHGPIGSSRLSAEFGGPKDRGSKPNKAVRGSGSVARKALQRLDNAGLLTTIRYKGRVISPQGQKLMDNTAHEIVTEMAKTNPELSKYC